MLPPEVADEIWSITKAIGVLITPTGSLTLKKDKNIVDATVVITIT